jgi:Lrp/AsnC family transcriptional regulator, leucine-responsive regulatory protein
MAAPRTKPQLDALDRKLLAAIRNDARAPISALAEKIGVSARHCGVRLRRLEESGVIRGYRALIDDANSRPVIAYVRVSLAINEKAERARIEELLRGTTQIAEMHLVAGDADYLLRVEAADAASLTRFLADELSRIAAKPHLETLLVVRTVKD